MRDDEYADWSDEELREAAQGCTEWTCMYHGVFNQVLAARKREE